MPSVLVVVFVEPVNDLIENLWQTLINMIKAINNIITLFFSLIHMNSVNKWIKFVKRKTGLRELFCF